MYTHRNVYSLVFQIKLQTEGDKLHKRFENKDGGEEIVEYFQRVGERLRHHVKLHRHRDNIETNHGRNRQVKVFGRYDVVNEQSRFGIIGVIRWFVHL